MNETSKIMFISLVLTIHNPDHISDVYSCYIAILLNIVY